MNAGMMSNYTLIKNVCQNTQGLVGWLIEFSFELHSPKLTKNLNRHVDSLSALGIAGLSGIAGFLESMQTYTTTRANEKDRSMVTI